MSEKLIWHIPTPGSPLPRYYIDRDTEPVALRIYAEGAPVSGDLLVDILDDGVSIMNDNNYQKLTFTNTRGYIQYGTYSGAFTVGEVVEGGTSGATAKVRKDWYGRLDLYDESVTTFTVGETITGQSSTSTATVDAYVRPVLDSPMTIVSGQSHANLPKGKNSNDAAQDFKDLVYIAEGSWLSLSVLEYAGAQNITVQLELEALGESIEQRRWAE